MYKMHNLIVFQVKLELMLVQLFDSCQVENKKKSLKLTLYLKKYIMDKVQPTGQNVGRIFKSRSG
jgi:hypothetical protein